MTLVHPLTTARRHITAFFHPSLWRRERIHAIEALDIRWTRENISPATDSMTLVTGLHKARYACRDIAPRLRHESAEWLRLQSMADMHGRAILPAGYLP